MLQNMGFLWAVTLVVWVGILYYVIMLMRRQTRLNREVEQVSRQLMEVTASLQADQDKD